MGFFNKEKKKAKPSEEALNEVAFVEETIKEAMVQAKLAQYIIKAYSGTQH